MRLKRLQITAYSILFLLVLSLPVLLAFHFPKVPLPIKIGLLIPDNKSLAARRGAEMAISEANKKGGYDGRLFQLVVRTTEGPWGTGSKEAVNLVFEEEVWAIVGSNDGRNGHIVEQVSTKAQVVFLSAWATDPSLSQAFVPWYFCCVPNDLKQADALIEEIYNKRKLKKVISICDDTYDSKLALKSFEKRVKEAGKPNPLQSRFYDTGTENLADLLNQINKAGADCIIIFSHSSSSIKLIQQMRAKKMNQPVFGTISMLDENLISSQDFKKIEGVSFVASDEWLSPKGIAFRGEYKITFNLMPGPVAAYAYDGLNVIIDAIRAVGPDREKIKNYLQKIFLEGVTGLIQFDEKGNRMGNARLMVIKNGIPTSVEN